MILSQESLPHFYENWKKDIVTHDCIWALNNGLFHLVEYNTKTVK